MPDQIEWIFLFRVIERGVLAFTFIAISGWLVWSFRHDAATQIIAGEVQGVKVAAAIAKPLAATALLLGYAFVSLSHPITVERAAGPGSNTATDRVMLFDEPRIFANLAHRTGGIENARLAEAQALFELVQQVDRLQKGKHSKEIEAILNDRNLSLQDVRAAVTELEQ